MFGAGRQLNVLQFRDRPGQAERVGEAVLILDVRLVVFVPETEVQGQVTRGFDSSLTNRPKNLVSRLAIYDPWTDTKRYINIADFVKSGGIAEPGKLSPLALAAQLDRDGAEASRRVAVIRAKTTPSPTLECELTDLEAWVAYGSYFAERLRAGVALATARAKNGVKQQAAAIAALERALAHWQRLAELGGKFNRLPIPSNSKEPFTWTLLTPAVKRDIEISRKTLGERKEDSAPKR